MPNADVRISEFTYDGFGRRVGIVEKLNGSVTDDRHFIWDGLSIVEEWDTTGASPSVGKRFFTHGEQRGAAEYVFLRDHLGSVREVLHTTGGQGELMAYDYTPYGERTVAHQGIPGAPQFDFGYTGHFTHLETGLVLAPYRAYMPETGRWLSRDPIGESGGINLYGYAFLNPSNFADPTGEFPWAVLAPLLVVLVVITAVIIVAYQFYKFCKSSSELRRQARLAELRRQQTYILALQDQNLPPGISGGEPLGDFAVEAPPLIEDMHNIPGTKPLGRPALPTNRVSSTIQVTIHSVRTIVIEGTEALFGPPEEETCTSE